MSPSSPLYFSGDANALGTVSALPCDSFASFVSDVLSIERRLPVTREQFHALAKPERDRLKRQAYITPATFKNKTSPRKTGEAVNCNLLCIDIDDAGEAKRLLAQRWDQLLPGIAYVAWHTISSTPEAPRLRVVISAAQIPASRYAEAVRTAAEQLGLTTVTHESLVPVQPMFLPTIFADTPDHPFVYVRAQGEAFTLSDILSDVELAIAGANADAADVGDIEYLRSPVENITLEDAAGALEHLDPDCPMQQWIEIGAALKHQFNSPEAYQLWDAWSAKGDKYVDSDETEYRWSTLKANPLDRAPVTIRSLFRAAQARGWTNPHLTHRIHQDISGWLRDPSRSTEQLLDEGLKRIAKAGPTLGTLEKKSLMATFKEVLTQRQLTITLPDIRAEVKKLEQEAQKTTGMPPWTKGLCFVTSINKFYRYTADRRFTPEVIDLMYSTPAVGDERPPRPRDYLVQVAGIPQVEALRYEPAQGDKRFYIENGVPYCNIYLPHYAKPDKDHATEAGAIFMDHIAHLVAEVEHRRTLVDFLAYHVQHPGKKIRWAILLQGGQGCGKTFLSVAMSAVLGRRNVRKLAATDVLNGQFNGWAYGQQLVFMEEVRIVGHNRFAIMDRLKPCISDDEISLRELHEPARTVPNISNYIMFTNHHDALAVNDGDRRYFVLASPLQRPEQIIALGKDYFTTLFKMVHENAGGLRAWFESYEISKDFSPEGRAPMTKYLKDLAETSASPLAAAVNIVINDGGHPLVAKDLVSVSALRALVNEQNIGPFSDQALALVLLEHGWTRGPRAVIEGVKQSLWFKGIEGDIATIARNRAEII